MKIAGMALAIAEDIQRIRHGEDRLPVSIQHPMGMTPLEFYRWFHKVPIQLTFPFAPVSIKP